MELFSIRIQRTFQLVSTIKIQSITKVLFIRFQFYYIAKGTTFILKAFIPLCHYEIGAGCPCIDRTVRSRNGGA